MTSPERVLELGADVPPEKFIDAVKARHVNIVCLSELLTAAMPAMRTIDALKQAGVPEKVRIMVGGTELTRHFADEIGANGCSDTACSVATFAHTQIGVGKA
jgi:5-methyltetrahydrofolate--homocysteine methyltransferase